MNALYERMTGLIFEGVKYRKHRRTRHPVTQEDETSDHPFLKIAKRLSATNPRRISAPSNFPPFSHSGKWKQHKIDSAEVEKKRAERSDPKGRKNVVAGLEDIIAQHYGQAGKKKGKQKSTGDLGKQKRKVRTDETSTLYRRMTELLFEARRMTRKELEGEAGEVVSGDKEGNWTYRRAKKAIRKAEAAGTFRLSKKQHKKLKGRGWSDKSKTSDLDTLRAKRVKQDRPGTHAAMKDMAKAVDAGEAPPAVATRHPKTGKLTQHAGRTRHTASKLFGGEGAEFAVISAKDRHKALRSKLRKRRREQQGGHTREPIKQTKNPPVSGSRFDSEGFWR